MTAMTRDELARHLYIHGDDKDGAAESWRDAGAQEWDAGLVTDDDVQRCYAEADAQLAKETTR